mgnify:CR=1 FL=1
MTVSLKSYLPYYRRNLKVAVPVMLSQAGQVLVMQIDNMMVGRVGTTELAAASFANSVFIIGMVFGMALAPLPNLTSKYILADVFDEIDFHYDTHQAAVEAVEIASNPYKPKFSVSTAQIQSAVDNPSDCNNTEGDYFQFEERVFSSHNCQIPSTSTNAYAYGYAYRGSPYNPQTTDNPARISFYEEDEQNPNSMFIELGD